MDAWNPDQLAKMEHGGNGLMNSFFEKYGIPKHTDIQEKYNSQAAEYYREKLRADVEGRAYTPPAPSSIKARGAARAPHMSSHKSYGGAKHGNDSWDAWDDGLADAKMQQSKSEYSLDALKQSAAGKEDFFARKVHENAMKPVGVAPSQGGKYVGFGSTPAVSNQMSSSGMSSSGIDDVTGMLGKKFGELSVLAGQAANVARDNAQQMTSALKEAGVAEKTKEYGLKGWALLRTAYASAASTIESTAAQQGLQVDLGSKKVMDNVNLPSHPGKYASINHPAPAGFGFEQEQEQAGWDAGQTSYVSPPRDNDNSIFSGDKSTSRRQNKETSVVRSQAKSHAATDLLQMDDGDEGWGDDWSKPSASTTNTDKNKTTRVATAPRKGPDEDWAGWEDQAASPSVAVAASVQDDWGTW